MEKDFPNIDNFLLKLRPVSFDLSLNKYHQKTIRKEFYYLDITWSKLKKYYY